MQLIVIRLVLAALFFISCRQREEANSPTTGDLNIICDESVSSVIQKQKQEFEKGYPKARLNIKLGTTNYAIGSLLNHDVECIVSTRELDSAETDFLIRHDIKVYSQKLALDGIAFIVNAKNPVDELNLNQLRDLLIGKIKVWKDVTDTIMFPRGIKDVHIVIDGRKSGNYYLLRNQVTNYEHLTASVVIIPGDSVVSSSIRILDFIATHEDAIGYISTSWLGTNPNFLTFSKQLKVLRLSDSDYHKAVAPIQGYVYRGDYPLRRMIYIMHRQKFIGLAAGFTAYLAGNEGQRLFLNSNTVPAMNPIHLKAE
jgi:phosphate transport system substrate-binding protein